MHATLKSMFTIHVSILRICNKTHSTRVRPWLELLRLRRQADRASRVPKSGGPCDARTYFDQTICIQVFTYTVHIYLYLAILYNIILVYILYTYNSYIHTIHAYIPMGEGEGRRGFATHTYIQSTIHACYTCIYLHVKYTCF